MTGYECEWNEPYWYGCYMEFLAGVAAEFEIMAATRMVVIHEKDYLGDSAKNICRKARALLEEAMQTYDAENPDWEDRYNEAILYTRKSCRNLADMLQNLEVEYPRLFDEAAYRMDLGGFLESVGDVSRPVGLKPTSYRGGSKVDAVKAVIDDFLDFESSRGY